MEDRVARMLEKNQVLSEKVTALEEELGEARKVQQLEAEAKVRPVGQDRPSRQTWEADMLK